MAAASGKGWCPIHDRVYARGSRCPRCKTPLVPVASMRPRRRRAASKMRPSPVGAAAAAVAPAPDPEPLAVPAESAVVEPDSSSRVPSPGRNSAGRWRRSGALRAVALVSLVVVGAFFAGRALPRGRAAASRADVAFEARPRSVTQLAGITMRLDRLAQAGRRVQVSLSVLTGFDPRELTEAFFEAVLEDGRRISIEDAGVRGIGGGFAAAFDLPDDRSPIRMLRITGLRTTLASPGTSREFVDVSAVWPVREIDEPRILRISREIGGEKIVWNSLVLWHDRAEVVIDLSAFNLFAKHYYDDAHLYADAGGGGPALTANVAGSRDIGNRLHLDFDGIPEDATNFVLDLGPPTTVYDGPWSWTLARSAYRPVGAPGSGECGPELLRHRVPRP